MGKFIMNKKHTSAFLPCHTIYPAAIVGDFVAPSPTTNRWDIFRINWSDDTVMLDWINEISEVRKLCLN